MPGAINAVKATFLRMPEQASKFYDSATAAGSGVAARYNISIKSFDPYHKFCENPWWSKLSTGIISAVSIGSIGLLFTKKWKDRGSLTDRRILGTLVAIGLYCAGFGIYHIGKLVHNKIQAFREGRTEIKISEDFKTFLANLPAENDKALEAIENHFNANLKQHKMMARFTTNEKGDKHYVRLHRQGRKEAFFTGTLRKDIWNVQKDKEIEQDREDAIAEFKNIAGLNSDTVEGNVIGHEILKFYHNRMFDLTFREPAPKKDKDNNPVIAFYTGNSKKPYAEVAISEHVLDGIAEKTEAGYRWNVFGAKGGEPTGRMRGSILGMANWNEALKKS